MASLEGKEWKVCPFCEAHFEEPELMRCPSCGCKITIFRPEPTSAEMFCKPCRKGTHRHYERCKNQASNGEKCKCRICSTKDPEWRGMYSDPNFVEDLRYRGLVD